MLFRRIGGIAALALLCCLTAVVHAQQWSHRFVGLPDEAVEGRAFRFELAYTTGGEANLNVQFKDPSNVVHAAEVRRVKGAGSVEFSIPVPAGKLGRTLLVAVWFGEDWQRAPCPVLHSDPIGVLTASEGLRLERAEVTGAATVRRLGLSLSRPVVAVLSGGWAGRDPTLPTAYARALASTGRRAVLLEPEDASSPSVMDPGLISLYVVPDARTYPGDALPALMRYLRRGGNIVCLGAPAFDRLVRNIDGAWFDEAQTGELLRKTAVGRELVDMGKSGVSAWERSANDLRSPTVASIENGPAGGGKALHVQVSDLTGWDTHLVRLQRQPAEGENLIVFEARGWAATTILSIEVRERDQSRWIATVPLTEKWERHALHTSAFALWDPEGRSTRRGPAARLNLADAEAVAVGLAFTHTQVPRGRHEFWFASLGSASGPELKRYEPPVLDTLSPAYKLYPVRTALSLDASPGRSIVQPVELPLPADILSTHPRPTGSGYNKGKKWRWAPLIVVRNSADAGGTLATLLVHRDGPYRGGRWVSFTAADREWYTQPAVVKYVASVARRVIQPAMLIEGGSEWFGCFPDELPRIGVRAVGPGRMSARITVTPDSARTHVFHWAGPLRLQGSEHAAEIVWKPGDMKAQRYRVAVDLLLNGKIVDRLENEMTIRRKPESPVFMKTEDGQFSLGGSPWYSHGSNYMPSSGIAAENDHYFEKWLSEESYDPAVIDRDLARQKALGLNMVSVFIYTESTHNHNLIDLLNRCDTHGLKVNLSLRPGTPLDFEWPAIGEIIKANRLTDDPTVIAYDLAWEPSWGHREDRRRWDGQWSEWVRQRYAGLETAELDWGAPIPREADRPAGLSDEDLTGKSNVPRMAAAYRRFLDDLLSRKHMEARQKVRSVDPNHLLSFRMALAGDPTCEPAAMPYDFAGLARSMDFMSPEGYGRIGEMPRVKPGWFTAAYSRMVAPGRPVLWAEFGHSLWNSLSAPMLSAGRSMRDALDNRFYLPRTIAFTERYYQAFYEMALASGSAGTVCWWYPGGFRVNENSDFGIINPDGTWRGITRIIKENAARFQARPLPPPPDAWIDVDRDEHPDGIHGLYARHSAEFWKLADEGKHPGLRNAGFGVTSQTMPFLAVGNTPLKQGLPPKCLNSEFEYVRIQTADGTWREVPYEGASVAVAPGNPLMIRLRAGNNGQAGWLSGGRHTGVRSVRAVASTGTQNASAELIDDIPSLGTSGEMELLLPSMPQSGTLRINMSTSDGIAFGEVRTVQIEAR